MQRRRLELLDGKLSMPKIPKIRQVFGNNVYEALERMWNALWYNYLKEGTRGSVSLPFWSEQIGNQKALNIALKLWSNAGWITSIAIVEHNWGEAKLNEAKLFEYVSSEELAQIRIDHRFSKYVLSKEPEATKNDLVRINNRIKQTGLVREGFRRTGNVPFQFDTDMMFEHREAVIALVNKGILKMIQEYPSIAADLASYDKVGEQVVENYLYSDSEYTSGQNHIDSRGRNIHGMLNKIGNPVGFKIMRSMLIIPELYRNVATASGLRNKYLFIAELLGWKSGTIQEKENFGRDAYYKRIPLETEDLDELPESIWLERTYQDIDNVLLDNFHTRATKVKYRARKINLEECAKEVEIFNGNKWNVPLEVDVGASIVTMYALILNDKKLLKRTNCIGTSISDPWTVDGVGSRAKTKLCMQKMYGSQQPITKIWEKEGLEYEPEEALALEKELDTGSFSVANRLKDFIIRNVKTAEVMDIELGNESFQIECNRFCRVGDTTYSYDLYDTASNSIRRVKNTKTVSKPDLFRFKTFFVTCLIHGLDSQIMNQAVNDVLDEYSWVIDIHDAMILDAEAADYARRSYVDGADENVPSLRWLNKNRNRILSKFLSSIGVEGHKVQEFKDEVMSYVEPAGDIAINKWIMK